MLIVALAARLLTQFFPCCAFAIRSFSKVSATPDGTGPHYNIDKPHFREMVYDMHAFLEWHGGTLRGREYVMGGKKGGFLPG